jgi:hypothetical protein
MRAGRFAAAAGLLAASAAGAALWFRGRTVARERVDLYFADGSMISFTPGSAEGERLLSIARRGLAAARG